MVLLCQDGKARHKTRLAPDLGKVSHGTRRFSYLIQQPEPVAEEEGEALFGVSKETSPAMKGTGE